MGDIACYCRVSTEDQNLHRQVERTAEYATDRLDADLASIRRYQDKSTGINVERSGYQRMMADADAGEFDAVVVLSVSAVPLAARR